uniref:Uncharacterized protein n=1 Tax=Picea glauca TaxID=3330 RepID=A0A101LZI6_PICGL|nr:hypothetical protein ABT39_MTgene5254 [Picea glauca]QHR88817.1 hypothetical protein Q903MT_gene2835 [Picea sitchensis]
MPSPSAIGMAPIPNNRGTGLKVRVLLSIGRRHTGVRPSFLVFLRFKVSGVSLARKESTSEAAIKRNGGRKKPILIRSHTSLLMFLRKARDQ